MNRISLVAAAIGALFIVAAYLLFAWLHGPWVRIDKHGDAMSFYDPRSVVNEDGKLRLRLLLDYDAPQANDKGAYRSEIESLVVNCSERGYYSEKRVAYEGRMASGPALFEEAYPLPYKPAPKFFAPIFEQYCKE
jgi:hypothetical protein